MAGILPTLVTVLIILFLMALFVANFVWHLREDENTDSQREPSPEKRITVTNTIQNSKATL